MFNDLSSGSILMFGIIIGIAIFVIHMMFKLGRGVTQAADQSLVKDQNKVFHSIWFWWVFTSIIYFAFNVLQYPGGTPTFLGHVAGFVGLFVPYGAISWVLFTNPLTWASPFVFVYLMYTAEKNLSKKNFSLLKRVLLNLLILLILTMVVDALRGTFFKSWDIFLKGAFTEGSF